MRISDWSSDVCSSDLASGYLLKPVVTAAVQVVSGSIDGYVASADGETLSAAVGTQVYAEQDGVVVRGTITDSDGHFILSPLEQSSAVGNYDVEIGRHTSELQSLMRISYAVFCLKKTIIRKTQHKNSTIDTKSNHEEEL